MTRLEHCPVNYLTKPTLILRYGITNNKPFSSCKPCHSRLLIYMRLFITLQLISLLSSAYIISTTNNNTPLTDSMALSKLNPYKTNSVNLDQVRYDYDTNWDCCNYVDPSSLPDSVNTEDLVVLQWNLRGLRWKLDDIDEFLNNTLEQKVGILIICETWLNNRSPLLPEVKGYIFIGKPRIDRKEGGIGFLIRNDLRLRRKGDLEVDSKTLENMIIEVKCKTNIIICSGYRLPNTNKTEFVTDYEKVLKQIGDHKHTNSIIGIDHNLYFINHSRHSPTQLYLTQNLENNMIPTITRPTRITQCSTTLIDNIFISQRLQDNYKSGILINDTSDHLPCYAILPEATDQKPFLKTISFQSFTEKFRNKICENISSVNWQSE